jgi:acetyl esterase/lipase
LLNNEKLGWTGEKLVLFGDSAGGVLITNIVQRSILLDIRVPDSIVCVYTPFLLTSNLSPSRLLSFMDPLLNTGVLWRSLAGA